MTDAAGPSGRVLEVLDPGALTTVQDLGRPGLAYLGVPRSGALDEPALRLANRLVGNPEAAAALEVTLGGVRLRASRSLTLAVTGAGCDVVVAGRAAPFAAAVSVPAGSEVVLGPAREGLRSYLAPAGGIRVPEVLGARSHDQLSGLGPAPLSRGDLLPVGAAVSAPDGSEPVPGRPAPVLRVLAGPRADRLTPESVGGLDGARYVVGPDSNRVGLRLHGAALRWTSRDDELPSEGMVLGAVQVPPDGQPVVFLNDHPTTGGYPVVGVVRRADLPVCAQARPGDELVIRLSPVPEPRRG
jgi:biotin-dependent carboxylase-like uncharacterized protein